MARSQGQQQRKCKECSMKLCENIDDISKADFYNLQAGHCTHLNSFKFPILQLLQLGGECTWCSQEFNEQGQPFFNDQVHEQHLVVVQQNFAVVKQAGEQGCIWISFRTNDNAMINTLAGRKSAMRAVLTNGYQM
ncbi:legumin A [Artemisia annua]|uniref:Legumin A n=1 Tax=Artemisia annua TaxID=35608 RepID=A0A2U1P6R7_ARTAN|nr:legumin A [Artemisia annua]